MLMEEAQPANMYIQERGQAIDAIEKTINELGSIFGQLAGMVQEQGEMLQRIDANTEDVVDNVQGAQRELLKYWSRVQGNRWLVAKMFGVLMVSSWSEMLSMANLGRSSSCYGFLYLAEMPALCIIMSGITLHTNSNPSRCRKEDTDTMFR